MNDQLYSYLKYQWKICNNPKYQKYFDEWVINLTDNQIFYYNKLWLK